jgi:zinc transport system substrate-binding protein
MNISQKTKRQAKASGKAAKPAGVRVAASGTGTRIAPGSAGMRAAAGRAGMRAAAGRRGFLQATTILALCVCCVFAGCMPGGAGGAGGAEEARLRVVATIFPPFDFARAITGGHAEVTMLLPPAAESHSFEPRPQDILAIQNCDVFIYVGGESDEWVRKILGAIGRDDLMAIRLIDCVDALEEEIVEGMQDGPGAVGAGGADDAAAPAGENGGHEDAELDEHVWTSPVFAKQIVSRISEAICIADASHADAYRRNTAAYLARLDELDAGFREVVDKAKRKTIVFGDRFPFRYLTHSYGLEYLAAFPGCSTGTEASAQTVRFLIDKVREEQIPVVFHIELSNAKLATAIAEEAGAQVAMLHSCHNISAADFNAQKSYIDLMSGNIEALRMALW